MKKLIALFAAAAVMLPLLSSCNPEDKPDTKVVMEPASTAEVAQLITFEDLPLFHMDGQDYEILSLEFTEDSRYILGLSPVIAGQGIQPCTKAVSPSRVLTGKYSYSSGKYITKGEYIAQVELAESVAKITQGTSTLQFKVRTKKTQASTTEQVNASRSWKVDNCYLKITGGINVESSFKGCDFQEIAQFLKNNGAKVDPSQFAGYSISEFDFTGANTMAVSFSNNLSFYGSYTLSGENITYTFVVINNKDIMSASASGTLTFPADKKADLVLSTTISGYSGTIQFSLSQN